MTDRVLLGFTVPQAEPFYIPVAHTVITGMTQFGKTTTEEAIFSRLPTVPTLPTSVYKVLVFLTKRGEKVFIHAQHFMKPFYRERFDWEYVRGLLEAAWKEKMRFETPWIIRICKGATSLQDVRQRLASVLTREKLRDFDRNIYTTLAAYMDKVLPVLETAKHKFTDTLSLDHGLNVMDLTEWYTQEEVQMLVIRSCMEQILKSENNVIVGLPEAWKMLPQARNTPVKLFFEKYIREGATNGCYLFIDAQDLGGVDKTPLRQVSVWIMGHMQEANEVERLLKQTLGVDVPAREIQTLPLGHFIVASGEQVTKVYVWPQGVAEGLAMAVARGGLSPEKVKERLRTQHVVDQAVKDYLEEPVPMLPESVAQFTLSELGKRVDAFINATKHRLDNMSEAFTLHMQRHDEEIQRLSTQIQNLHYLKQTPSEPGRVELDQEQLTWKLEKTEKVFKGSTADIAGKIMFLAQEGFFGTWHTQYEVTKELENKPWTILGIRVKESLDKLVEEGWLAKRTTDRTRYKLAFLVKVEVEEAKT